jgi:short-subunit dehydrogenase
MGSKISVSLLAPGPVKTEIFRESPPQASQQFHATVTQLLDQAGLTPDEFAPLVFAAIDRGDYWIIPQPEHFDERFTARNAIIAKRAMPEFFRAR